MFKNLTVTLYDLFGYLIPGLVTVLGFALFSWAVFYPEYIAILHGYDLVLVAMVLGAGYLVGHIVQGIANAIEDKIEPESEALAGMADHMVFPAIKARIEAALAPRTSPLNEPGKPLQELLDYTNAANGITTERDTLVHRKGMYRGLVIAFGVLCAGFLIVAFRTPLVVEVKQGLRFPLTVGPAFFTALLCVLSVWASWTRYMRFCKYKVEEVFLTFSASQFLGKPTQEEASSEKQGATGRLGS